MDYIIFSLIWAMWRRLFGGFLKLPRTLLVVVAFIISFCWGFYWFNWWIGLIGGLVTIGYWTPKHQYGDVVNEWSFDYIDCSLITRYGHVGLAWIISRRLPKNIRLFSPFIDGPFAIAELLAGLFFGSTLSILTWVFSNG